MESDIANWDKCCEENEDSAVTEDTGDEKIHLHKGSGWSSLKREEKTAKPRIGQSGGSEMGSSKQREL